MRTGLTAELAFEIADGDTARALGSGDLDVLATPRLVAWLEAATCAAVADALEPGTTTVGTRIDVEHRAASPVGARVLARARLTGVDGRVLRFEVEATDAAAGAVLGAGEITRVVVERERFLARLG